MKKIVLGSLVTINLLLTGCGSSSPKKVAIDFATALSDADIASIKKMASNNMMKEIDKLSEQCNTPYIDKLMKESARVYNLMNQTRKDKEYKEKITKIDKEFQTSSLKLKKEIQEKLIKKYGTLNKVPQDVLIEKFLPLLEDYFGKTIEIMDIKMKEPKKIKAILSKFMTNNMMETDKLNKLMFQSFVLEKVVREYVKKHPQKITSECVEKYTDFGSIDSVNFIEESQKSPDKIDIRLEVVYENDKSKKVLIGMEQIQGEWKVSSY